MTTATKTARLGRPIKTFSLSDEQLANAVNIDVLYNGNTQEFDYYFGGQKKGSAKNVTYIRNRVLRGQLKSLAIVSNNFTKAFRLFITDENGKTDIQTVQAGMKK